MYVWMNDACIWGVYIMTRTRRSENNFRSWSSLTMLVLRLKQKLTSLVASTCTLWAILLAPGVTYLVQQIIQYIRAWQTPGHRQKARSVNKFSQNKAVSLYLHIITSAFTLLKLSSSGGHLLPKAASSYPQVFANVSTRQAWAQTCPTFFLWIFTLLLRNHNPFFRGEKLRTEDSSGLAICVCSARLS